MKRLKLILLLLMIGGLITFLTYATSPENLLKETQVGRYQIANLGNFSDRIVRLDTLTGEITLIQIVFVSGGKVNISTFPKR